MIIMIMMLRHSSNEIHFCSFNISLAATVDYILHLNIILILKCERLIEKISYERRPFELVDNMSLSSVIIS